MLVTAGNAVLLVRDTHGRVTQPVVTAVPLTGHVRGTITRVLTDTGHVLVDAGNGQVLLLSGLRSVVGDAVSINVDDNALISSFDGEPGAIEIAALGDDQPIGTVATLGVLNAGNVLVAEVNGLTGVTVANVTGDAGGISNELIDLAIADTQILGDGDGNALIEASLLSGGSTGSLTSDLASVVNDVVAGGDTTIAHVVETGDALTGNTLGGHGDLLGDSTSGITATLNGSVETGGDGLVDTVAATADAAVTSPVVDTTVDAAVSVTTSLTGALGL